jgi:hypothetical protein
MSESAIRAQIKTILEGVTGIGPVHDYERYPRSFADLFEFMRDDEGKVNGWMISRASTDSHKVTMGIKGQIERVHTYRIGGLYELDDANGSEKALQALLDDIYDAFRGNDTLNGTVRETDLLEIQSVDVDAFGDDMFHIAECRLVAYERVSADA